MANPPTSSFASVKAVCHVNSRSSCAPSTRALGKHLRANSHPASCFLDQFPSWHLFLRRGAFLSAVYKCSGISCFSPHLNCGPGGILPDSLNGVNSALLTRRRRSPKSTSCTIYFQAKVCTATLRVFFALVAQLLLARRVFGEKFAGKSDARILAISTSAPSNGALEPFHGFVMDFTCHNQNRR